MKKKPKIFVIGTGGAIASTEDKGKYIYGDITQEQLLAMDERIKTEFDIESTSLFRLNSANMQPEHWFSLANMIYYKISSGDYDGIVVTHGTATMQQTATAMSFLVQNIPIPIVFTGSSIIPTEIGSDAQRNFYDALRVAASDIAEAVIVFNGKILRGTKTKHIRTADFDPFDSMDIQPLGSIQYSVVFEKERVKRNDNKPVLFKNLETNVALIKIHPGMTTKNIDAIIDIGVKGIVLQGHDYGTMPTRKNSLIPSIQKANEKSIPVILSTKCAMGQDWKNFYFKDVGAEFDEVDVIFGFNMHPDVALIKLMWALTQTKDVSKIKKLIHKSIAGEITPIKKNSKKE